MDYGSSRTTDMINPTDDHFPKDEKDFSGTSRKTVTIAEPTDIKSSTDASKETEPLLTSSSSQRTEQ